MSTLVYQEIAHAWEMKYDAACAELGRVVEVLKRVQHAKDCPAVLRTAAPWHPPSSRKCTCGLQAALTPSALSTAEEVAKMRKVVEAAKVARDNWLAGRTWGPFIDDLYNALDALSPPRGDAAVKLLIEKTK